MYLTDDPIKENKEVIVVKVRIVLLPGEGDSMWLGRDTWGFQDAVSVRFLDLAGGYMDVCNC